MFRWIVAAVLACVAVPAVAGPSFDIGFRFSRDATETYTGVGTLFTGDGPIANSDGSFLYTVSGASGTITTNFNNPVSIYTINGVSDFFGNADNTVRVGVDGSVTAGKLGITFDGGPGSALLAPPAGSMVFAGEGVFTLDSFTIRPAAPVSGAVPEPAMWAMMIVGMGLAGAGLRRHLRASDDAFTARIREIAASGDA